MLKTRRMAKFNMRTSYQIFDEFLQKLIDDNAYVAIFLTNGVKLLGHIDSFDKHAILLRKAVPQLVFIHAVSSVIRSSEHI